MKKGYNSSDIPQQEGQDQARRLYRFISDNARRLDDARGCARSVSDLFVPGLLAQRSRLRENCERLIFLDPILFGRKGEELLWRKVYYDVVSTSKRLKKQDYAVEDIAHLQCHIDAGLGYYHHFISRLQLDFDINLQGIVDFPPSENNKSLKQQNCIKIDRIHEWAEQCVHRCLIYLGDLSRYKLEIYPNWDHGLAIRYYLQASSYKPEYGMPHNQLGTLASGQNCSLDAVYHYMRCLCCTHVFEGTENNLRRLFEKNSYVVENFPNEINNLVPEPTEHIKRLIAKFLLMIDILYFEKNGAHIHNLCHQVLLDLQTCLTYSKPVVSENGDSPIGSESYENDSLVAQNFLSSDTVFKMIIICLMCIIKLQKNESQQISAVKAFLLAVYSQLIQNINEHIQGSVFNMSLPSPEPETKLQNGDSKKKTKRTKRIVKLRRRLKSSSEDSDLSESEIKIDSSSGSEINSEVSDNEIVSSSSEESDAENKTSDGIIKNGKDITTNGISEIKNENDDPVKKVKRMDPMDLLEIVADEGLLQSVKILSDWLTGDIVVLKECGNSSQILLKKIIQLLNFIHIEMNNKKIKNIKINTDLIQRDYIKIPLPEDIILKGVSILNTVQNKIDWNYLNNLIIEPKEEALFRINKLIAFGHFLADIKETGIIYDKKKKCFDIIEVTPKDHEPETTLINNDDVIIEESVQKNNESISRGKLMKHMGQLWLAAEVQDLETRVQGRTAFSPYLVLDVDALIHHTHLAKQLVSARKFIVLVPIIVLSALDELKRETIKAREAIRWLETQFHHGSRFLRAQRPQEHSPIPLIKYPKKKDKETYTFIQIIECCHFLTQQQKGATNLVTLLTGNQSSVSSGEPREISYMGLAQSAGVNLEFISSFHLKWKKSMKGHR